MAPVQASTKSTDSKQLGDPRVIIRNNESDLKYLRNPRDNFSDCTIVYNGGKREAHMAFLSRTPRFPRDYLESRDTFSFAGFEPYEVKWLLEWVYYHKPDQAVDVSMLSSTRPNGKRMGNLVNLISLAQIARFYHVDELEKAAMAAFRTIYNNIMRWTSEKVGSLDLGPLLNGIRQAFSEERKPCTSDEFKWLLCRFIQKHRSVLHKSYIFCKTLRTLDSRLRQECALGGCLNCLLSEKSERK